MQALSIESYDDLHNIWILSYSLRNNAKS